MDLLRVSLELCHSVGEKSSKQDAKVTFPGSQSPSPPVGQGTSASLTRELQVLFSFCLRPVISMTAHLLWNYG